MEQNRIIRVYMPDNQIKHGLVVDEKEIAITRLGAVQKTSTKYILQESDPVELKDAFKCLDYNSVEFQKL